MSNQLTLQQVYEQSVNDEDWEDPDHKALIVPLLKFTTAEQLNQWKTYVQLYKKQQNENNGKDEYTYFLKFIQHNVQIKRALRKIGLKSILSKFIKKNATEDDLKDAFNVFVSVYLIAEEYYQDSHQNITPAVSVISSLTTNTNRSLISTTNTSSISNTIPNTRNIIISPIATSIDNLSQYEFYNPNDEHRIETDGYENIFANLLLTSMDNTPFNQTETYNTMGNWLIGKYICINKKRLDPIDFEKPNTCPKPLVESFFEAVKSRMFNL